MNTDKMLYWIAVGIFALGISREYQDGKFPAAHRALGSAESTLCRLVTRAEQAVAMARVVVGPPSVDDVSVSIGDLARGQAELLRDQAQARAELMREQIHAQAEVLEARAEIQRAQVQWQVQSQFGLRNAANRQVTLVCPKTGARVSVKVNPPVAEIGDSF